MRAWAALVITLLLPACTPAAPPSPTGAIGELDVTVVAGPVCPVETVPPDPACAPRPVPGARVFVSSADGRDFFAAPGATNDEGVVRLELPPGDYLVSGGDVEGLFGRPESVSVTIVAGETASATLTYDTGIR